MAHLPLPEYASLSPESQHRWEQRLASEGEVTHMKQTLLYSAPAYDALMEWFPLRDELLPLIGERGVIVFSHAISTQNECLLCSLYFRRALIARGEDPDARDDLSEQEHDLAELGRALVSDSAGSPELTARLVQRYGAKGFVDLVAYAGIMMATNLINTALDIDPDDELLALLETKDS